MFPAIVSAVISAIISMTVWILNYYFVILKDREESTIKYKEMSERQMLSDEHTKKQFLTLQGKEDLLISYRLHPNEEQKISIVDENDQELTQLGGFQVAITKKIGWISKIVCISSSFKNTDHPIIDTSHYIDFKSEILFDYDKEDNITKGISPITVIENNNSIIIGHDKVVNYYSEKDWRLFYQFYLIMGANNNNHLVMFGCDKFKDQYLPFILGKEELLSTINTINQDFQKEYMMLRQFLEDQNLL